MTRISFAILLVLIPVISGCNDRHPTAATAVAPPQAVAPQPTVPPGATLVRGYVYDPVGRPVGGATVEVLDGPQVGATATSSWRGEFTIIGEFDDSTRFRAARDGYLDNQGTLVPLCPTCGPGRWLFLYLNVPDPPVFAGGDFTVTFTTDSRCSEVPDDLRIRRYAASVVHADGGGRPSGTHFEVRILDAALQDQLGHGYFAINVAGRDLSLELGDFHGQPGVVEQVGPTRYLAFGGGAAGHVEPGGAIDLPFIGFVDYCAVETALTPGRYACPATHLAHARCESAYHRVTLTRR